MKILTHVYYVQVDLLLSGHINHEATFLIALAFMQFQKRV